MSRYRKIIGNNRSDVVGVRLGFAAIALVAVFDEVGDGDRGQDADDGDDDHEFDQGETFLILLKHFSLLLEFSWVDVQFFR